MIKLHQIEDHLIELIPEFHGTGHFLDSFIEQAHQLSMIN